MRELTRQQLGHATYDLWFIHTAEAEVENEEWKRFGVMTTAGLNLIITSFADLDPCGSS